MNTVIYSCVTGKYDKVLETLLSSHGQADAHTDFVLFTDRPDLLKSGEYEEYQAAGSPVTWSIRPVKYQHPTCNVRTARWHKINSHLSVPEYDYSIWIDGSQVIQDVNLRKDIVVPYFALPESKSQPLATFKHPDRICVYQEAVACRKLAKDNPDLLIKQAKKYREEGYPPYNGMVETACLVRSNNILVRRFNQFWWDQIENHSRRDQMSFNYTSWKLGIDYGHVIGNRVKSPYFKFVPHGRR
tara:strand:+ start:3798 stop:4526 length:729 start_codon:yes stop_codon:yes gene_type:complete